MHLTLKQETAKPAAYHLFQQQSKCDDFMKVYNHERPHQAIGMKYPAELYTPLAKEYRGIPELEYPFADKTVMIT